MSWLKYIMLLVYQKTKKMSESLQVQLCHGDCCQNHEIKELLCVSPECVDPQCSCTFISDSRYMFGINTDT